MDVDVDVGKMNRIELVSVYEPTAAALSAILTVSFQVNGMVCFLLELVGDVKKRKVQDRPSIRCLF